MQDPTQDQNQVASQTASPEPETSDTPQNESEGVQESQIPQETPVRPLVSQPPIVTPMSWEHTGDPAEDILRNISAGNDVKAAAWDAYHKSKNEDELTQMIQSMNLPVSVKEQLWDAKHKGQPLLSLEQQAQARHAQQAQGWKVAHPNVILPSNTPPTTMQKIADTGESVLEGAGKEASKTVQGITNLVNKGLSGLSNFVGDVSQGGQLLGNIASKASSPTAGLQVAQNLTQRTPPAEATPVQIPDPNRNVDLQTHGIAEGAGGIAEQTAEWLAGEEALRASMQGFNLLAKAPPQLLNLIQKYPRAAQLITSMAKGATIGGAQGAVKGAAEDQAGKGAVAGAESGAIGNVVGEKVVKPVAEAVGAGLEKIAPKSINAMFKANKIGNYLFGHNPGQSVIDEQIKVPMDSLTYHGQLENINGQYEGAISKLNQQVQTLLNDPAVAAQRIDIKPVVDSALNDARKFVANQYGIDHPKYFKTIDDLEKQIMTIWRPNGTSAGPMIRTQIAPAWVSEIKTSLGKNTRWVDKSDPEFAIKTFENELRKKIYGQLADEVEKGAERAVPGMGDQVHELNRRLGNAIEAQGLLHHRIAFEAGSGGTQALIRKGEGFGGLTTLLGGIFTGNPIAAGLGGLGLTDAIRRTPAARVATARGSAAAGGALKDAEQDIIPALANWLRMQLSDGRTVDVHPEDHDELKQRDAGAQVMQQAPQ